MHPHVSSFFLVKPYEISRGSGLIEGFIDFAPNVKVLQVSNVSLST